MADWNWDRFGDDEDEEGEEEGSGYQVSNFNKLEGTRLVGLVEKGTSLVV